MPSFFFIEAAFAAQVDSESAERSGYHYSEDGDGEDSFSARQAERERYGAYSRLNCSFGQIGYHTEEAFLEAHRRADKAQQNAY